MPILLSLSPLEQRDVPSAMSDRGPDPFVVLRDAEGNANRRVAVYESTFTGGVWTAAADVNGDGVADVLAAPGPGRAPEVKVVDGKSGEVIRTIQAYEAAFTSGTYVVSADLNGDGKAEIVTGTDQGGGPRVRVFDGATDRVLADFFAIDDSNFRGGVRVSLGDMNGDSVADLVVSAGFGGGPRIAGFDGKSVANGKPTRLFADFFAFENTLRNGCYPAVGDADGDGFGDLLIGAGPGGGPRVTVFSGKAILTDRQERLQDFFAGDTSDRSGVRVGAVIGSDGKADLLTAPGVGVTAALYNGPVPANSGLPPAGVSFEEWFQQNLNQGKPLRSVDRALAFQGGLFADTVGSKLGTEPTAESLAAANERLVRESVRGNYVGTFPAIVGGAATTATITYAIPTVGAAKPNNINQFGYALSTTFPMPGAIVTVAIPGRAPLSFPQNVEFYLSGDLKPSTNPFGGGFSLTTGSFTGTGGPVSDLPYSFSWAPGQIKVLGPVDVELPDGTLFRFADGKTEHLLAKV